MAQNTIVEQQLHVMVFFLKAAILVGLVALYVVVSARFLFHQQPKVARHEVNAPLQAQFFANERRFEQGFRAVEPLLFAIEKAVYNLSDVLRLVNCHLAKGFARIEVSTGAELHRTLFKGVGEGLPPVVISVVVNDIV